MIVKRQIPPGWAEKRLRDVATINPGSPPVDDPEMLVSFLPMEDVSEEARITGDQVRSYSEVSKGYTSFQNNDVLIAKITPCFENGKGALATNLENGIGFGSTEFHILRAGSEVEPEFLYYSTLSHLFRGRGKLNMQGSAGQKRVPTDFLRSYHFLCPPRAEQHKIADILGTWDKAIALTEQLVEAKQRRKKALMQQLLTGRRRFKEFEGTDTQHTKYGKIPSDWTMSSLGSLMKPIHRMEPVVPDKDYRLVGVRWYIEGAHIHDVLPGSQIETKTLSRVEENDILYNKMWASKSAFAIAKRNHHGAYGTAEYPQFRAKPDCLSVDFSAYAFHLPRFLYEAKTSCRGTTGRARLNPNDFLRIEIPVPPLAEQRKIAAALQTCDEEIELLIKKLDALRRQKKGLMQQLLTGRVRVKVA